MLLGLQSELWYLPVVPVAQIGEIHVAFCHDIHHDSAVPTASLRVYVDIPRALQLT